MKLAWLTDIHLNFLRPNTADLFCESLASEEVDAFLITGDIGEAPNVGHFLNLLDNHLQKPIYFVLGNHDFYRGSFAGVREEIANLCAACPNLCYLTAGGVVQLTDSTCLVGHDGWADGRFGDYFGSDVALNDWLLIEDLADMTQKNRLSKLQRIGDESAEFFRRELPDALDRFSKVIVATHVPPFREACWHEGRVSDDNWLPHMSCKAVGDVLREMAEKHPEKEMLVLCGHTHGEGEAQILPNLKVITGGAEYGRPRVQRVLTVD